MYGWLRHYFADDRRRLDELLDCAVVQPCTIDETPYAKFRLGMLKHIGLEEKDTAFPKHHACR